MSCCCGASDEVEEQKKRSMAIDRMIEEDAQNKRRECRMLLLGVGNSGKSTILKQMKIIHHGGYTTEELALCRATIYKNVLECARAIVEAMRQFGIEAENPENKEFCDYIMDYNLDSSLDMPLERTLGDAITSVWNGSCVAKVLEHENEFYLMDNARYFFDEVNRITAPDYLPTEADILRSRTITTGICETRFSMGELRMHLFDFGHLQGERKKWIHCFENVTSIILPVALSDYDRVLCGQNVLMESLVLFDSIANSRLFRQTSIILFLNKVDVFKNKLARSPFRNHFPDYLGGNDVNGAAKYLLGRFDRANQANLFLYPQYVNT